jgi:tetratricopeptide (TPR) repeat protein
VLAVAAVAFQPCLGNGFVDWDDDVDITDNPHIRSLSLENLETIFFTTLRDAYHPLPFLVWAVGYRLWGETPFGYHLVNLLLHLVTAALVFRWVLLLDASLPAAAAAALWFGIHPMRVESVAWVSDLKDLLAGLFFMAALLAYERLQRERRARWYAAALGLFFLAGMSKTTALTLPAVLVLVDFLRRRRLDRRAILEKVPFFAVAALFAVLALVSRGRFEASIAQELAQDVYPVGYRLYLVGERLVFYFLQRTVAPTRGVENLYPDVIGGPYLPGVLAWGTVLIILLVALALSTRFSRKGVFGAGFFLVALSPALATVSYGYTADRFSYVPAVGIAYLVGVAAAALHRAAGARRLARAALIAAGISVVAALGSQTWRQCGVWSDSVSLWSDAVATYRRGSSTINLGFALVNRGHARLERGDYRGALADLDEALPIAPNRQRTLYERACVFTALGERGRAIDDLGEALRVAPGFLDARQLLEVLSAEAVQGR